MPYKVMRQVTGGLQCGELVSLFMSNPALRLTYREGETTTPRVGLCLAFRDLAHAVKFIDAIFYPENRDMIIVYECEGEIGHLPSRALPVSYLDRSDRLVKKLWDYGDIQIDSIICGSSNWPRGTIGLKTCKLIRRVEDEYLKR